MIYKKDKQADSERISCENLDKKIIFNTRYWCRMDEFSGISKDEEK